MCTCTQVPKREIEAVLAEKKHLEKKRKSKFSIQNFEKKTKCPTPAKKACHGSNGQGRERDEPVPRTASALAPEEREEAAAAATSEPMTETVKPKAVVTTQRISRPNVSRDSIRQLTTYPLLNKSFPFKRPSSAAAAAAPVSEEARDHDDGRRPKSKEVFFFSPKVFQFVSSYNFNHFLFFLQKSRASSDEDSFDENPPVSVMTTASEAVVGTKVTELRPMIDLCATDVVDRPTIARNETDPTVSAVPTSEMVSSTYARVHTCDISLTR